MTLANIVEGLRDTLELNVEGCGFVLRPGPNDPPYILRTPNLATNPRSKFETDPSEMWLRVRDNNEQLLAVIHNHPQGCFVSPSTVDTSYAISSRMNAYVDNEKRLRLVPWIITNGVITKVWLIDPSFVYHYTEIHPEALSWLEE